MNGVPQDGMNMGPERELGAWSGGRGGDDVIGHLSNGKRGYGLQRSGGTGPQRDPCHSNHI